MSLEPGGRYDKKILIIEDNEGIATALTEVLSDSGYEIDVASNGKKDWIISSTGNYRISLFLICFYP